MELMNKSKWKNKKALEGILKSLAPQGEFVKCPVCSGEWNKLTPEGMCFDCQESKMKMRESA